MNQLFEFRRGALSDSNADGIPDTVSSPSRTQSWNLDALGNWNSLTSDGTPQSRTHNQQNQVTQAGSSALTFDANGNLTRDETGKTMVYDAWNRLVQVKDAGGAVLASYHYDALNGRIVETSGGTTRDLYYSAAWQVIEERINNQPNIQYVWSPVYVDALIARDRDADANQGNGLEERLYVIQDGNWNVTGLVNITGQVVERYAYDPYGSVTFLSASWAVLPASAFAMVYLHQGGRYDTATNFYQFRFRDLSPTLGRWLEIDPIGFGGGDVNFYRMVGNNPTNFTDPEGLTYRRMLDPAWRQEYYRRNRTRRGIPFPHPARGTFSRFSNPNPAALVPLVQTGLEIGASTFIPGVGEVLDLAVIGDPESAWWEKGLAGLSLGVSVFTGGLGPNAGAFLRGGRRAAEAGAQQAGNAGRRVITLANNLPTLPGGYHYRNVAGRIDVVLPFSAGNFRLREAIPAE